MNTTNHCVQTKCNDWMAFRPNSKIGRATCHALIAVVVFMCFEGVALKGGGRIILVGYIQTQVKIASFTKLTNTAFNILDSYVFASSKIQRDCWFITRDRVTFHYFS